MTCACRQRVAGSANADCAVTAAAFPFAVQNTKFGSSVIYQTDKFGNLSAYSIMEFSAAGWRR